MALIDWGNISEIAAAAVAVISAILAGLFSYKAARDSRLNQHLQLVSLKQQYFSGLLSWANDVVTAMSDAISLCYLDPKRLQNGEFFYKRHLLYSRLSALLDQGRWFFPNLQHLEHGQDKEKAFRGIRQEVLNTIEAALRLVKELNYVDQAPNRDKTSELVKGKRAFVSEVQQILDPRRRDSEFEQLMQMTSKKFFKSNRA
jgi:hypothetical protein